MAGRVVYLVANGLVAPDRILGLTFTRKAAGELAERIRHRLARLARVGGLSPELPAAGDRSAESGDVQLLCRQHRGGARPADRCRAGRDCPVSSQISHRPES